MSKPLKRAHTDNAVIRKMIPLFTRHVGRRLRAARRAAGLSQEAAAGELGLGCAQLQKYEEGRNRIGAGELYILAYAYGVKVEWLFEGAPGIDALMPAHNIAADFFNAPHGHDLARQFLAISDKASQHAIVIMTSALKRREQIHQLLAAE